MTATIHNLPVVSYRAPAAKTVVRDYTGKIGPLYPRTDTPEWPMYSYGRPSSIVWDAIANELRASGWSDRKICNWLQSKSARWALDFELGDALATAARAYARKHIAEG